MSGPGTPRTRRARELAESAYGSLLRAVGHRRDRLLLIGGLVPEHLVESEDPHQGTNDVDVLLDIGVVWDRDELDFTWLEDALRRVGFVQASPNTGWRWVVDVDGFPVLVEFLVDVADSLDQEIALPGASTLGAKNLRGPGPALRDVESAVVAGQDTRITGLGGYLAAKGASAYWRRGDKDLYDFAWVLVADLRAAQPRAAAAVSTVLDRDGDRDRTDAVLAACRLFDDDRSPGALAFAELSAAAGSTDTPEELALDAVVAVEAFGAALRSLLAHRQEH